MFMAPLCSCIPSFPTLFSTPLILSNAAMMLYFHVPARTRRLHAPRASSRLWEYSRPHLLTIFLRALLTAYQLMK